MSNWDFSVVEEFEKEISNFFGSNYAVAVDCCTHALELCLLYTRAKKISVPHHTYISIPFLSNKLNIDLEWKDSEWEKFYYLTDKVVDAAVLWEKDSYIPETFMCISFQFKKHLSLGRGGVILVNNKEAAIHLKKMSYDGREPHIPWGTQNINMYGYHYYMTPETAALGLKKLPEAIARKPKIWTVSDWPNLTEMEIFK